MTRWIPAIILCLSLALGACSQADKTDVSESGPPEISEAPETYANAIDRNLPQTIVAGRVVPLLPDTLPVSPKLAEADQYAQDMESYAFLVWQGGSLQHANFFEPYDQTLRPDSASMHKSVLALVIGAAIADGHIASVDDPVSLYIPEWEGDVRGAISIKQLLQMSSGLRPLSTEGGAESESGKFVYNGASSRSTVLALPADFAPGERFHYSNAVSQLLCLVVEAATGVPYTDYLSQQIWQPIGANDALVWLNEPQGFPRTYTALMARADDWLRIGLLIKDRGAYGGEVIIPEAFVVAMTSPSSLNPNYGYQVWLGTRFESERFYNDAKTGFSAKASQPFAVGDMIYLDGFGGQRVYISRSLDLVIVRTGNIRFDWDDTYLPNTVVRDLGLME